MKSKDNPLKKAKSVAKKVATPKPISPMKKAEVLAIKSRAQQPVPEKKTNYLKKAVDVVGKDTRQYHQTSPSGRLEENKRVEANKKLPLNYKKLKSAQAISKIKKK